jgi:hypothetical protein
MVRFIYEENRGRVGIVVGWWIWTVRVASLQTRWRLKILTTACQWPRLAIHSLPYTSQGPGGPAVAVVCQVPNIRRELLVSSSFHQLNALSLVNELLCILKGVVQKHPFMGMTRQCHERVAPKAVCMARIDAGMLYYCPWLSVGCPESSSQVVIARDMARRPLSVELNPVHFTNSKRFLVTTD